MPDLVVVYGAPLSGKTSLAWRLARSFPDKTAIVGTDQLLTGSIAVAADDASDELDMVHVQLRLLVANYLKNGYNVVVEGPFIFERDGHLYNYEADIDQLLALMRHLTSRAIVVQLQADEATLARRAAHDRRNAELPAALRIGAAYRARYGVRFYSFDTVELSVEAVVLEVRKALADQPAG